MKNILYVTHTWGGGIPVYISDLIEAFQDDYNIFILKCFDGKILLEYGFGTKKKVYYNINKSLSLTEISNSDYRKVVSLILKAYEIDLIHINITLGHTFDIYKVAKDRNISIVYTVHDYFYICPTFHMVDHEGSYCNGCEYGKENEDCLKNHPYINNPFDKFMLKRWRDEFIKIKENIDCFIFPSFSCKKYFLSFYSIPENKCRVIYHGTSFKKKELSYDEDNRGDLQVGILGSMFKHKGESLFKYILDNINDEKIKFYHYGEGFLESNSLTNYGVYERSKIIDMLKRDEIDVILLLSTWPETFSYTLTESIVAGIPPIVTNLGALKERVEMGEIGWVVDYKDPEKICELLHRIKVDRLELKKCRERIKKYPIKSITEMSNETENVYKNVYKNKAIIKSDTFEVKQARSELEKIEYKPEKEQAEKQIGAMQLFFETMTKN